MSAAKFQNIQQKVANAVAAQADLPGSALAGVPVVLERFDVDPGQEIEPALANSGIVLEIGLPESGAVAAGDGTSVYFVSVLGLLIINPAVLYGPTGMGTDPLAVLDEITAAIAVAQRNTLGPHHLRSSDVPVERLNEETGFVVYIMQFALPVVP